MYYAYHILKTRLPKDKLFAWVCSIEESYKSFKSQPLKYFTSYLTRIEKAQWLKRHASKSENLNHCQKIKQFYVLNAIYRFFETNNIIEVMQTEVINTSIGRLSTVPFLFYM